VIKFTNQKICASYDCLIGRSIVEDVILDCGRGRVEEYRRTTKWWEVSARARLGVGSSAEFVSFSALTLRL
jgi:hypothetical protein